MAIEMRVLAKPASNRFPRSTGQVYESTATGCAFNLVAKHGKDKGRKMSKAWHVKSTLPEVTDFLHRSCSCPPNYRHALVEGQNIVESGRYTPEFVAAVHRMFSKHLSTKSA